MFKLKISFEDTGTSTVELGKVEPGQSLLEVCMKHEIPLGHKCGGMCVCSTCQVLVVRGAEYIEPLSIREKHFIARASNPQANSRLACQCLIMEGSSSGVIEIMIPNQKGD